MIQELGLNKKKYKISGDSTFISNNKNFEKFKSVYYYFKKVLKESKKKRDDYLRSRSYIDYCIEILGKDIGNYLKKRILIMMLLKQMPMMPCVYLKIL